MLRRRPSAVPVYQRLAVLNKFEVISEGIEPFDAGSMVVLKRG